ncbi:MAG TPA: hypothetical protein VK815_00065 [Candidatus Acidoferrales bacterium]|jgi:hypothetical protein|nr:hypothetical protein [Candidatus Acidoferrales bacterium]
MNAEAELLNAYREWHRLARAEAKAISTRNWDLLADCQLAIADFQVLITRLTAEARGQWERAGIDCAEKERHIQVFIHELIGLTRQNQAMLQRAKDGACARLGELGEASRNLKRLRQSYGHAGALLRVT